MIRSQDKGDDRLAIADFTILLPWAPHPVRGPPEVALLFRSSGVWAAGPLGLRLYHLLP